MAKKRGKGRKKGGRRRPVVLAVKLPQIGSSDRKHDLYYHALKPGKRRSRTGKIYYERRRNRSDASPEKRI
ncbi:MAG: hypothetical protein QXQ70_03070 [Candidatus Caldarchaeum sp.]